MAQNPTPHGTIGMLSSDTKTTKSGMDGSWKYLLASWKAPVNAFWMC